MKRVWIVVKNDKIHAVFDNPEAAENHRKNAAKGWSITKVVEMEVFTL